MTILRAAERPISSVCFSAATVQEWPPALRATLVHEGILEEAPLVWQEGITCDICGETTCAGVPAVPKYLDDEVTIKGFVVACPHGYATDTVPVESARTFRLNSGGLATWLAHALQTDLAQPEAILPDGRLWWLGYRRMGDRYIPCYLAIGANRSDAADVFRTASVLRNAEQALVFTPTPLRQPERLTTGTPIALQEALAVDTLAIWLNNSVFPTFSTTSGTEKPAYVEPIEISAEVNSWRLVTIHLVNTSSVEIHVGDRLCGIRSYDTMGFADERTRPKKADSSREPYADDVWRYFMRLAFLSEQFTADDWTQGVHSQRDHVKQWRSKIGKRLKSLIPTLASDEPLSYSDTERVFERQFRLTTSPLFTRQFQTDDLPTRPAQRVRASKSR